jgi:hypothetical protein
LTAFDELIAGMAEGRGWSRMGDSDGVRALLDSVYNERCHGARHHREAYQLRVNLQKRDDAASYAGWITGENPTSGPVPGHVACVVPGRERGSVAVLVIGTDGFGADAHILGRPGHRRRLKALSRRHGGRIVGQARPAGHRDRGPRRGLVGLARHPLGAEVLRQGSSTRPPPCGARRMGSASPTCSICSSTSTARR